MTIGLLWRSRGRAAKARMMGLKRMATLSAPRGRAVSVSYATAPGGATPVTRGRDYVTTSGRLTFPAGTTSRTIEVAAIGDVNVEADECLLLKLLYPVNATVDGGQATGIITNDDSTSLRTG